MKIVVFNGSPKGMTSVTMQYVLFLRKKFPQHEFVIFNVGQEVHKLESDEQAFARILEAVTDSSAVLWAFPVYVLLVPAYYKRFIELLFEKRAEAIFKDKYTAIFTTSIHFFDNTAHEYVNGICDDLGMKFFGIYSAEMYDLAKKEEQTRLLHFANQFLGAITRGITTARRFSPIQANGFSYDAGQPTLSLETVGKKVFIVSDAEHSDSNLARMVARFKAGFRGDVSEINLHAVRIRGGCMGCIQCGLDNHCVYRDADDIFQVYQQLRTADVLILAGTIHDRYLSSRWKLFLDRGFFNGHVPIFAGKQMGYLISGPLRQVTGLRQVLEAYVEVGHANLVDIVTDETGSSLELDQLLDGFANRLMESANMAYVAPPRFHSVAGWKIFRDEVWASLRFVFQADHRFYKTHGLYNFPRRSWKQRVSEGILTLLTKIPSVRRQFLKRIKEEMIKPLVKVVEKA